MPREVTKWMLRFYRPHHVREDLSHWRRRLARHARRRIKPPLRLRNVAYVLAAVLASGLVVAVLYQSALPREAVLMSGIFVLAALLWVTEALPLFATAILVMGLEIVLLANPGAWRGLGFETGPSPDYRTFLAPISDPIIVLFLGGFLMAQAAIKKGGDHVLASSVAETVMRAAPCPVFTAKSFGTSLVEEAFENRASPERPSAS